MGSLDLMVYPTFEVNDQRGILPTIRLPRDFQNRLPAFYERGRKQKVEDYAKNLETMFKTTLDFPFKIELNWTEKEGLTEISTSPSSGFYLETSGGWPMFSEHNLGALPAFATGFIAMKYISELLKSEKK